MKEINEKPTHSPQNAYIAMDVAKVERWDYRPICCGSKVGAFDEGSFICNECDTVYES